MYKTFQDLIDFFKHEQPHLFYPTVEGDFLQVCRICRDCFQVQIMKTSGERTRFTTTHLNADELAVLIGFQSARVGDWLDSDEDTTETATPRTRRENIG